MVFRRFSHPRESQPRETAAVSGGGGLRVVTSVDRIKSEFNPQGLQERLYGTGNAAPVRENQNVVLCLMKSEEIEIVIAELQEMYADDSTFVIEDNATFYRLENEGGFEIDLDEIEPLIGHRYDVFDFMVNVTTTIGRAYNDGNKFIMTSKLMGLEEPLPSFRPQQGNGDLARSPAAGGGW